MSNVQKSHENPFGVSKASVAPNKPFDPEQKAKDAYNNAKQRCENPKNPSYPRYGGKGIKVLFEDVADFLAKVGLPPTQDHTIDRIDPNGHYEVTNLRWVLPHVQANNKKATKGGATLSLQEIVSKAKGQADVPNQRILVTVGWDRARKALQRGYFIEEDRTTFEDAQLEYGAQPVGWRMGQHPDFAKRQPSYFSMPSLTHPGEFVIMRGGPFEPFAVQDEGLLRSLAFCADENIPDWLVPRFMHGLDLKGLKDQGTAGSVWVGQVSPALLRAGGFEGMMLTLASRLRYRQQMPISTSFMPMLKLYARLQELGPRSKWDEYRHPILDARALFIPDFQLDVGSAFEAPPGGYGKAVDLLRYRREAGLKTFVGVQNPNKLPEFATTEVFGHLDPVDFSNELISPHRLVAALPFDPERDELKSGWLDFADLPGGPPKA